MSEIQKTTDYSIFKKHESNRELDNGNIKKILSSIKARNLLQFRPILVDSEMRVIDGQHRLEVAKRLGLEIFYQVQRECTHEDIVLLNQHQKGWKIEDYVDYYISLGNKDYLSLKRLTEQLKCSINFLVKSLETFHKYDKIKDGSFKYFKTNDVFELQIAKERTEEVIKSLLAIIIKENKFIKTERFKLALCRFLKDPSVDFSVFIGKLRIKSDAVKPCSSLTAYQDMFLNIYNWKNSSPITLKDPIVN